MYSARLRNRARRERGRREKERDIRMYVRVRIAVTCRVLSKRGEEKARRAMLICVRSSGVAGEFRLTKFFVS